MNPVQNANISTKRKIEINGHRIDDRLSELQTECEMVELRIATLIKANSPFDSIVNYTNMATLIKEKIAKWSEIKHVYELNVNVTIFDNRTMTLFQISELAKQQKNLTSIYHDLLKQVSENKDNKDSIYNLGLIYSEFRKQQRLLDYYNNSVNIAKAQVGIFELDEKMFDD